MSKFESTIVLDHGSGVTRCGFAEDEVPRALIPTVVGYHRETSNSKSSSSLQQESPLVLPADPPPAKTEKRHLGSKDLGIPVNKLKIGNDALKLRYFLDMAHPLNENGVIVNFDALEDFWKRIYKNVLKGNLFLSNLIISLSFRNPAVMTEKCAEILFEKFNVPKLIVSNDDTLAAKYFGLQTGVLVDMGHFSTRCIPVFGKKCLRKGHCYKLNFESSYFYFGVSLSVFIKTSCFFFRRWFCERNHAQAQNLPKQNLFYPEFQRIFKSLSP